MLELVSDNEQNINDAHVIVVGNEKGGSGKTTISMHISTCLVHMGFKVGTLDIDSRQQSLSRYMENREYTAQHFAKEHGIEIITPEHYFIPRAIGKETVEEIEQDEHERFMRKLAQLKTEKDFIIVDSPGNSTYLSRLAHSHADTVITPINDSFIDFDLLARIDNVTGEIIRPSLYSEMVWSQRMVRAQRDGENNATDWIVICNRLSHLDARNKRNVMKALDKLSNRVGFRVAPGFTERVIYRELFPKGLTMMDIIENDFDIKVSLSHIAARAEVRDLLKSLKVDKIDQKLKQLGNEPEEQTPDEDSDPQIATSAA